MGIIILQRLIDFDRTVNMMVMRGLTYPVIPKATIHISCAFRRLYRFTRYSQASGFMN
jgi:hypothetical protein